MLLFSQKASKCNRAIPQYPRKLGKPLLECLNLQGYSEFVHLMKIQSASISQEKRHIFNKTHLVLPACVHFQQESSFSQLRFTLWQTSNSQAKTKLRTPSAQNSSQWLLSVFVLSQISCSSLCSFPVFFSLFFSFFLESESLC